MKYCKRIVEETIKCKLTDESIVNIVGPRECGKTTVALRFAKSSLPLDEKFESLEKLSEFKPQLLLEGEKPLLIDDIERIPVLNESIITASKRIHNNGLFITTNSLSSENLVEMHPLSLYESGESSGEIKVLDLFENPDLNIDGVESRLELEELIDATSRGGFPRAFESESEMKGYIDRVIGDYIPEVCGFRRNPDKVKAILRVYADNIYTPVKNSEILKQVQLECPTIAKSTYYKYLRDLRALRVVDEIPSWGHMIKAPTSVRTASRKGFCDPSIPISLLNLNHWDLLFDLAKFEYFFKNLCYRDLKVYTSLCGGKIGYYADRYGCVIDCILQIENGDYALINFDLSGSRLDNSIKKLLRISRFIERKINSGVLSIRKPKFLAIITASQTAYTHKDGVLILPVSVLK